MRVFQSVALQVVAVCMCSSIRCLRLNLRRHVAVSCVVYAGFNVFASCPVATSCINSRLVLLVGGTVSWRFKSLRPPDAHNTSTRHFDIVPKMKLEIFNVNTYHLICCFLVTLLKGAKFVWRHCQRPHFELFL